MKMHFLALAAFAALPFQVACDIESFADSGRYREDFQYTYQLKPGGRLSLDNFNGSVEILSWEKDSVQVVGTKYAGHEEDLRDIRIDAQSTPDQLTIRTVRPSDRGNMGARYVIRVPRKVELDRIASSNGQIRVEDIEGNARLETSNGAVRLRKIEGKLDVRTSNGSIEATDVAGDANLRTSNGAIRLERCSGAVQAGTSNGSLHAQMLKPREKAPMRFHTSNGSLEVEFENFAGNEVHADTSNGSLTLRLPEGAKAHVRARTSHHEHVDNELSLSKTEESKGFLEGDLNGGGPTIDLSTSNSTIKLFRL